jgi:hypothetical protein
MCSLKIVGSLYRYVFPMVSTDPSAKATIHDLGVPPHICLYNLNKSGKIWIYTGLWMSHEPPVMAVKENQE